MNEKGFSHIDNEGSANMVDISSKEISKREAVASCEITLNDQTYKNVKANQMSKGNVINIAHLAGITAVSYTHLTLPTIYSV